MLSSALQLTWALVLAFLFALTLGIFLVYR